MLKFIGDVGLYLPDKEVIRFSALNGKAVIGCYVTVSALVALGGSPSDTTMQLVDRFHRHRGLLERVIRSKWGNSQVARDYTETTVTIAEADLYDYSRAWGANANPENLMLSLGIKPRPQKGFKGVQRLPSLPTASPTGKPRVLVVEDDFLVAQTITDLIEAGGCEVIGPAADAATGLDLLARKKPDAAVLDIKLIGETSYPVAAALMEQRLPFLFVTGYDEILIPSQFAAITKLMKPGAVNELTGRVNAFFVPESRPAL
jgi:CheY-like chemotaxis protein